jgi:hypothetical protein
MAGTDRSFCIAPAIKYIRELTVENERLRAENVRQAKELMDRHNNDPNTGDAGNVGIVGDDDNDEDDTAPKADVPSDEGK